MMYLRGCNALFKQPTYYYRLTRQSVGTVAGGFVQQQLQQLGYAVEIRIIKTQGDVISAPFF
ncbi:MAG: hypothetical protein IPL35_09225 [Sphingobacteriales bacterium]|nr:hypothetical protein [Sphingobacteriales bacterium]